ncbi:Do family serine endopeptidase [Neptunicella sp. SCSIO 80796]|uniref:Do family serine endopeptidase n=1 Tax=Neptunicella plasticusilytica TaxID=3117012 RepID=UPI003A4E65E0
MKNAVIRTVAAITLSVAVMSSTFAAIPFFSDDDKVPSLAPMLEEVTPAVVSISVEGTQVSRQRVPEMFKYFFGPNAPDEQVQERPFRGLGSGVIIDADKGYIVTNNHVIDNANEIRVKLTDGREFDAKMLGSDEQSDIALLQIKADNLVALKMANSDKLRVGDFVIAIGNPFGLGQTVTSGIVSALGRTGLNIEGFEDFIQTDAAINRGNSGGALVNLHGELEGINTAILGPGNIGIGFAIPANMVKSLTDQIVEFGEVRRGLLGITGSDLDSDLADAMGLDINQGAVIREVTPDSAADKAGLAARDVITAINGKKIHSFLELRAKVSTLGAGSEIKLTLVRDGKTRTVTATLGDFEASNITAKEIHPSLEGAVMSNGKTKNGDKGVEISELAARSPAARVGLQKGDVIVGVNRHRVETVAELRKQLEDNPRVIALNVKRGDSSVFLVVR